TRLLVLRDISDRIVREQEMEAISRVSAALRSPAMREDILQAIVRQILELFQAEACAVLLNRPGDKELIVNAARGNWEHYLGETLQPFNDISVQVNNNRKPYIKNKPLEDPQFAHQAAVLRNIAAVACIPLMTQQVSIGVLWLGTQTPIEEKDIQLLTSIADIAASSLHRAELYEETQQRIQRLAALRNIDITITASLDLRLTLDILLGQVTSHLNVDAASVLLFNSNLQVLEYVTGNGFRTNTISRSRLRLGEGHAGLAALERRTIHIANLQESGDTSLRRAFISAEGFITYYAIPLIAKGGIKGVLEIFHRSDLVPDPEWLDFLEALATQAAIAIENARLFDDLQRSNMELILAYDATLEGWIHALDLRDKETEGHTQRVTTVTLQLAREVGVNEAEMINIRRGALLHDIGKVAISDSILRKTGPLTPEERAEMEQHPVYAYELLSPISYLQPALDIPYCHHEKWDGTGYPRRLKGEQIPLTARIFAIVDVWDALRSNRPYREAWPENKVLQYLANESGKHFDPRLLDTFLNLLNRLQNPQP
ncbi:MAG: GAF domain-containing protein, partial [Chloroflexi bacterium]